MAQHLLSPLQPLCKLLHRLLGSELAKAYCEQRQQEV